MTGEPPSGTARLRPVARVRPWLIVWRPVNVVAYAAPLLIATGFALDWDRFSPPRCLGLAAIGVAMQVAIRYLNDHEDFRRGIDQPGQMKGYHALSQGLDLRRVHLVGLAALAAVVVLCVWLSLAVDPRLLVVTAVIALCAYTYAGGPWPYSSHALGEVAEFIWFGLLATVLATYVQAVRTTPSVWVAGAIMGCVATCFMVANNTRDVETDRRAGKLTLVQVLGRRRTRWLFSGLLAGAYALVPVMAVVQRDLVLLLALASLPLGVWTARRFATMRVAADFAPLFGYLRLIQLAFAVLLFVGLLLPRL